MHTTYTYSTNSHKSLKPAVGIGDSGVGKVAVAKNYQLSILLLI